MMRSSVDLPQPDGPISETNSPGWMSSVDVLQRRHAGAERLREAVDRDDDVRLVGHATFSGARRSTSRSVTATATKKTMPSAAQTTFVAQRNVGSSE